MKRVIWAVVAIFTAGGLAACGGGGGSQCQPGEQASLTITTNPTNASVQADGKTAIKVTITGKDEFCQPLRDTQVELSISNQSEEGVGEFSPGGTTTTTVVLGKFGATVSIISRKEGTAKLEAFCAEHNLTALPVDLTFTPPQQTGQCAVELVADPTAIEADGKSTSTITATLKNDKGGPMPDGTQVRFTTTKGKFTESNSTEYTTNSSGSQAVATLMSEQLSEDIDVTVTATFTCDDGKQHAGEETVRFGQLDKPSVDLRSSTSSIFADDVDAAELTAEVKKTGGIPAGPGVEVDFVVVSGPGYFKENHDVVYTAITDSDSIAKATFVGGTTQGKALIRAAIFIENQNAYDELEVNVRALGSVRFISATPTKLGVKGSGRDESSDIVFQLLDTADQPFPAGALVEFSTSTAPGVTLDPASARTDDEGKVRTTLNAGYQATTVTVTATAKVGAVTLSATTPSIAIVGAKPNARFLTFSCERLNTGGFSLDFVETKCTASLADRFSNKIGFATNVTFRSEAGAITAEAQTSEQANSLGMCTVTLRTSDPRPWDVTPIGGEPVVFSTRTPPTANQQCTQNSDCRNVQTSYAEECINVSTCRHSHNPRDGLVTLIAATTGEEEFSDTNGNGQYEAGEPFIDLSEPFVDVNDNGIYDLGEPFIDSNNSGSFDTQNGIWDSNTIIWKDYKVLWTGRLVADDPSASCSKNPMNRYSIVCAKTPPLDSFSIARDEIKDFLWEAKDQNLNPINQSLSVACSITGKGQYHAGVPSLPYSASDVLQGDWPKGGGFAGTFQIKGSNSGNPESGVITIQFSFRESPGEGATLVQSISLQGQFVP